METVRGISGRQKRWEGRMNRQSREDFFFLRILCDTAVTDTCHCMFVTAQRIYNSKKEPNVDCRI